MKYLALFLKLYANELIISRCCIQQTKRKIQFIILFLFLFLLSRKTNDFWEITMKFALITSSFKKDRLYLGYLAPCFRLALRKQRENVLLESWNKEFFHHQFFSLDINKFNNFPDLYMKEARLNIYVFSFFSILFFI